MAQKKYERLPLVTLRDLVVFPGMNIPLFVGRPKTVAAIEEALKAKSTLKNKIVLTAQKEPMTGDPLPAELYTEAVVGEIQSSVSLPNNMVKVVVSIQTRAEIMKFHPATGEADTQTTGRDEPYYVRVRTKETTDKLSAAKNKKWASVLKKAFLGALSRKVKVSPEIARYIGQLDDAELIADLLAGYCAFDLGIKQKLLQELNAERRCEVILNVVKGLSRDRKKSGQANSGEHKSQADAMEALQAELNADFERLSKELFAKPLTEAARIRVEEELKKMRLMPAMSAESSVIRSYLDWIRMLPWEAYGDDNLDLEHATQTLDADHYALDKVKDRILEHLAVQKLVDNPRAPILCLVGPPGVGKTSLAESIARASGREFVRLSLGGVKDESEIRGHRRTYIGAMPGKIIGALKRVSTSNPVILLDEIDKMASDFRGDPQAALLEVLDPAQNRTFMDHYLDLEYDLSRVLFICTANSMNRLSSALRDRLEILRLSGYTEQEKVEIARQYLIPKQLETNGLAEFSIQRDQKTFTRKRLKGANIRFSNATIKNLIEGYTREAGVRNLERQIGTCARKVAMHLLADAREPTKEQIKRVKIPKFYSEKWKGLDASTRQKNENNYRRKAAMRAQLHGTQVKIGADDLEQYLGPKKFIRNHDKKSQIGVTRGLAYTSVGGEVLLTEVLLTPGKGKVQLTGKLGDVMKESAKAAIAYTRSRASHFGLSGDFSDRIDVHIHVPKGATPKDGPSAGVTLATSIISALTRLPVRHDVAMTGEISLRGRVLAIGGLKEKALAAHRMGIKTVVIPKENEKDLEDIPEAIREKIRFVPVEHIDEVLEVAIAHKDLKSYWASLKKKVPEDVFGDESFGRRLTKSSRAAVH